MRLVVDVGPAVEIDGSKLLMYTVCSPQPVCVCVCVISIHRSTGLIVGVRMRLKCALKFGRQPAVYHSYFYDTVTEQIASNVIIDTDFIGRRRYDFRVRLFVCLFVRSTTKIRMIIKFSSLVYGMTLGCIRSDMDWLKGQMSRSQGP